MPDSERIDSEDLVIMPPLRLNRRRFLGCSAAASVALSQGAIGAADAEAAPVRLGVIGIGNRGTAILRTLLDLPGAAVIAVGDPEPKHRLRGQGIVEKAQGRRPDAFEDPRRVLEPSGRRRCRPGGSLRPS